MASEISNIDDIDRKIINLVQNEPDLTHSQIAKKVDRSQPTIGMRIKKLQEIGILQYAAGTNVKSSGLYFAMVEVKSTNPKLIFNMVKKCPLLLNAIRLSGNTPINVLIASDNIEDLDKIVNDHFRNNPYIENVSMNLILDTVEDFILPLPVVGNGSECCLESSYGEFPQEQNLSNHPFTEIQNHKVEI